MSIARLLDENNKIAQIYIGSDSYPPVEGPITGQVPPNSDPLLGKYVGYYESNSASSVTIAANTSTNVKVSELVIQPGEWLIMGWVNITSSVDFFQSYAWLSLVNTNGGSSLPQANQYATYFQGINTVDAYAGFATQLNNGFFTFSVPTKVYIMARCNSTASVTVNSEIQIVRVA